MLFFKNYGLFINEANESTSGLSIEDLNSKIQEWNSIYSQAFKFQNDMPKDSTAKVDSSVIGQKNPNNDSTIAELNTKLLNQVREGIIKMAELLTSKDNDVFIFKGREISVFGHTSSPATPQYNQALAQRRSDFVINAIKSAMKSILSSQNDNTSIDEIVKFKAVAKGESSLLITNDTVNGDAVFNTNNNEIQGSLDSKAYQTPEQKQALNRRVVIGLDKLPIQYPLDTPKETKEVKVQSDNVKKPVPPEPSELTFNMNSYYLTDKGQDKLYEFINQVLAYNKESANPISDIWILAHTNKGEETDKEQEDRQKKLLYILSLNRSFIIKKYLIDKGLKNINIHLIPCSYLMNKGKKVEIFLEENDTVKKGKEIFKNISGIEEYTATGIQLNQAMRDNVIENIKQLKDKNIDYRLKYRIPMEYWVEDYTKLEPNVDKIKKELISILGEDNVVNYVYPKNFQR